MSAPDYLAEIERIAEQLRDRGMSAAAAALDDAVHAGATGTEILMAARHCLLQQAASFSDPSDPLAVLMARLADRVSLALQ